MLLESLAVRPEHHLRELIGYTLGDWVGMTDKPVRRPNAFKHGGFSKAVLLPWESEDEFQSLHRELQDEWKPSGTLEEDAVFTILTCIWRKRRVREKRTFDTISALKKPENVDAFHTPTPLLETNHELIMHALSNTRRSDGKARDRATQLLGFSSSLYRRLDGGFLELTINMLGKEFSTHLNNHVPKASFSSTPEWVAAIKQEVDDVLLPKVRAEMDSTENLLEKVADFMTPDRILGDLALEERLDATIDRAIRRLAQAKMMKQVSKLDADHPAPPATKLMIEGSKPSRKRKRP